MHRWPINNSVMQSADLSAAAKLAWHYLSAELESATGHPHSADLVTATLAIADALGLDRFAARRATKALEAAGLITILEAARPSRAAGSGRMKIRVENPASPAQRTVAQTHRSAPAKNGAETVAKTHRSFPAPEPIPLRPLALTEMPLARDGQETAGGVTGFAPHTTARAPAPARPSMEGRSIDLPLSHRGTTQRPYGSMGACARAGGAKTLLVDVEKPPRGAGGRGDEFARLAGIGQAIAEVLARVPDPGEAKAALAGRLKCWLADPACHPSVLARAAEAVVLGQVPYEDLARVVVDLEGMRRSKGGLRRPAGALFVHLCRKAFQQHGLLFLAGSKRARRASS